MDRRKAIAYALLAAAFYALSMPASKLLLSHVGPTVMAAMLYLGAGLGVGAMSLSKGDKGERLARADLPYVVGMIALDVAAPILLMLGVSHGTSSSASLLGNFEIVSTTPVALPVFREAVSGRLWGAIALITAASILLSFDAAEGVTFSYGSLFVVAATVCWGFENNCTRMISSKSTYQIVVLKGIFSGLGAFVIALAVGESLPQVGLIVAAMLLGFVAYGLSIFLYVRAQSALGAAKTSAYYAVAPFIGAALSFALLHEPLSQTYMAALGVMAAGTLVRTHNHEHSHTLTHTHGSSTHTHVVTHSHAHSHYLTDDVHGHRHTRAELERSPAGELKPYSHLLEP